jgi:hypothetical protein
MRVTKWMVNGIVTIAALIGILAFSGGQAYAGLGEFSLTTEFMDENGEYHEGIALDESTNDVYTYNDDGSISKFDADGNPVNFSALGSNTITATGSYGFGETELAVDNSEGPAKGDIYLAGGSGVKIYGPEGAKLGELTEVGGRPWGEVACGVAVDGSGHVYVGLYPSTINEYTPTASPVTNSDYTGSHGGFNEICNVAADRNGAIYAATWTPGRDGEVVKLDSFQASGTKEIYADAGGTVAAANSPSSELFVNRRGEIRQYDSAGNLLSTFGGGVGKEYFTIAINAKNGRLYTFDRTIRRAVEIWQGVVRPQVRTTEATGLNAAGNGTLNGSVDPEGDSVESCSFQYGLTESYGSMVSCAQGSPLTGTDSIGVSADLSGLTLNHTYHYRLSTADSHGVLNGSDLTFTSLVRPLVEDQQPSASEITRSSARLAGAVDPEQGETRYRFEYGPTEDYVDTTPVLRTGDLVSGDVPVNQQVVGLLPDTIYHYRLVATNVAGTTFGADHTFTSGEATPPSADTGGAGGVAQNTATITGTVNTNGLPTSYGFEIATSTDYGPATGLGYIGAGSSEAAASLELTGLVPGTTYHYRLTASNVDGTVYGADETFTTSVFASTFAEPPAPLPFVAVPLVAFPTEARQPAKKTGKTKPKAKKRKKTKGKKAKGKKAKSRKK